MNSTKKVYLIDTNIILRYLLDDHKVHSPKAGAFMAKVFEGTKKAAIMFSIFQTIALCGLNCNHWLRSYLTACAENHGKAPDDLSSFLPWEMDEERRHKLSRPPDTS